MLRCASSEIISWNHSGGIGSPWLVAALMACTVATMIGAPQSSSRSRYPTTLYYPASS